MRSQGDIANAKKKRVNDGYEFRARLAQSKLLILQGVEALKKQQFDDALALFDKLPSNFLIFRPATTTGATPRVEARTSQH